LEQAAIPDIGKFLSALKEVDLNPIVGRNRGLRKHVEFDHAV
jgi:hypothetical protein